VLIGDSGVGKSCLLLRFADDTFTENYIATIGVDFRFKTLAIEDSIVKLQIWDTAGQERFQTITSAYYRGADGAIIVFDKTNPESFEHLDAWVEEIKKYSENCFVVFVGNKSDLKEEVSDEAAQKHASEKEIPYLATSALNSQGVIDAFTTLAKNLINRKTVFKEIGDKLSPKKTKKNTSCCKSK